MNGTATTEATTLYESDVEYEVDGETRRLVLIFEGATTDYYWNYSTARNFYAERIEREGGKVVRYGTHTPDGAVLMALDAARQPKIDRPHRFAVGDRVRTIDESDASDGHLVVERTWSERSGKRYPTYTLRDRVTGEDVADVLDTRDLVQVV